jgi:hypothetical protein
VEVADAVRAVIRRGQPHRAGLGRPGAAVTRPDRERTELVERETAVRELAGHLLDPVQLGVLVRILGLLPRPGPLKRHPMLAQQLAQPLTTDPDPPVRVRGQVRGELAHAPVRERPPELARAGLGRRDDELDVLIADQAGTASRPLRVQRGQPPLVEGVNHIAHGVLVSGHQPGDRRNRCPRRRRHDNHRSADPDRAVLAPAHDLGQPLAHLIGEPARSDWLCHPTPHLDPDLTPRSRVRSTDPQPGDADRCVANPVNVGGHRTSNVESVPLPQPSAVDVPRRRIRRSSGAHV